MENKFKMGFAGEISLGDVDWRYVVQDRDMWLQAFLTQYWGPGCHSLVNPSNWRQLHQTDPARRWRLLYWYWLTSQFQNANFFELEYLSTEKKNNHTFTRGLNLKMIFLLIIIGHVIHQAVNAGSCSLGVRFISKATAGHVLIISSSAFNTTYLPNSFICLWS